MREFHMLPPFGSDGHFLINSPDASVGTFGKQVSRRASLSECSNFSPGTTKRPAARLDVFDLEIYPVNLFPRLDLSHSAKIRYSGFFAFVKRSHAY
jgi:hypothetical protein